MIKVKNCVLSKTPDEKIADFTELKKAIHKNGLNDVLFRTSPKVVDE